MKIGDNYELATDMYLWPNKARRNQPLNGSNRLFLSLCLSSFFFYCFRSNKTFSSQKKKKKKKNVLAKYSLVVLLHSHENPKRNNNNNNFQIKFYLKITVVLRTFK